MTKIPNLWQDGLPIRYVSSDIVETYTYQVAGTPVRIVQASPNRLRRRVVIIPSQSGTVFAHSAEALQTASAVTIGGILYWPSGFYFSTGASSTAICFESCGEIWARNVGVAISRIGVMIEGYYAEPVGVEVLAPLVAT